MKADSVLIVIELLCLASYLVLSCADEGSFSSAWALIGGELAPLLWLGVVVGGLILPFVLERFVTYGNSRTQFVWIAAFLLGGGLALRFCIVGAGAYDITQVPTALYGLAL